jgi:hypothetical protein
MVRAVAVLAAFALAAPAALADAPAQTPGAAPAWRQVYENGQTRYFVDQASAPTTDPADMQVLLQFKAPQVVDGDQVWSVISNMRISCGQKRLLTQANQLHALKMGTGPVVQTQAVHDVWHQPQPGSLGETIWSAICAKPAS